MENIITADSISEEKWLRYALVLAVITIFYNLIEGIVSIYFGTEDEALTLFGFGFDSFIETISAIGIYVMIRRISLHGTDQRGNFERTALKITGWGFYILSAGLAAGAVLSILSKHKPGTTVPGIIISLLSISCMWLLIHYKRKTGRALSSDAILADANCNLVCLYMSVVLLASSFLYTLTGFGWFDALGALGLVWFSFNEGREAFEKAKGKECGCHVS